MSEMTTPASFIASVVLLLFIGTIVATVKTESLMVFIVGMAMTLFIPRAMIGVGRN